MGNISQCHREKLLLKMMCSQTLHVMTLLCDYLGLENTMKKTHVSDLTVLERSIWH